MNKIDYRFGPKQQFSEGHRRICFCTPRTLHKWNTSRDNYSTTYIHLAQCIRPLWIRNGDHLGALVGEPDRSLLRERRSIPLCRYLLQQHPSPSLLKSSEHRWIERSASAHSFACQHFLSLRIGLSTYLRCDLSIRAGSCSATCPHIPLRDICSLSSMRPGIFPHGLVLLSHCGFHQWYDAGIRSI